jgi:hypothetical protein
LNQNFLANGRQLDFIMLCDFWHKSGYILPSQTTTRRFLAVTRENRFEKFPDDLRQIPRVRSFNGTADDSPAPSQRDENHSAQGCEATLGHRSNQFINPGIPAFFQAEFALGIWRRGGLLGLVRLGRGAIR